MAADPERRQPPLVELGNRTIIQIEQSDITGIREVAMRTRQRMQNREVWLGIQHPEMGVPSLTGVVLFQSPDGKKPFLPAVMIKPEALGAKPAVVQADMVRSLAIVNQFPSEDSLGDVYDTALNVQAKWLRAKRQDAVAFDPRAQDDSEREDLIKKLMGDHRYYFDFGLTEWNNALTFLETAMPYRKGLEDLRGDVDLFMTVREQYGKQAYDAVLATFGFEEIRDKESTERADKAVLACLALHIKETTPLN